MKRKKLFSLLFIVIISNFCLAQVKNTYFIGNYNYYGNRDGLIMTDVKITLISYNQEKSGYEGKKNLVWYNVSSNVDLRYEADSYRYKGKVYQLSEIKGYEGFKPRVGVYVKNNFGEEWSKKMYPVHDTRGLNAFEYEHLKKLKSPYDLNKLTIASAVITDSRDASIEAQIEKQIKAKERAEKEAQNKQEAVVEKKPRKKKEIRIATNDDFWSGKSTTNSKTSEDDFWSGESTTNSKKNDDGFWNGENINVSKNAINSENSIIENTEIELVFEDGIYTIKNKQTKEVLLSAHNSECSFKLINCEDCKVKNKYLIKITKNVKNAFSLIDLRGKQIIGPLYYLYYTENDSDYSEPIFYAQKYISERKTRTNSTYINFEYRYVTTEVTIYDLDLNIIDSFEIEEKW